MKQILPTKMAVFMQKNGFYPDKGEKHLLAVSGGLDSLCMVHLYHALGLDFGIAHCNFQLRGDASKGDAYFVELLAEKMEVPFHLETFDTKAAASFPGISTQMAARDLRYAFFQKIKTQQGYSHIATAHHRDDDIETALFNFGRGTSLSGMRGIPIENNEVIRPLLGFGRSELETYAAAENLHWREDSSNAKDDYARNFIRHHIIPRFKELNPSFSETAKGSLDRLKAAEANLNAFSTHFLEKNVEYSDNGQQKLTFEALTLLPYPAEFLRFWLADFGFDREQCRQLAEHIDHGQSGLVLEGTDEWQVTRNRNEFVLSPKNEAVFFSKKILKDDLMVRLSEGRTFFMTKSRAGEPWPDGKTEILADAATFDFPLTLRSWKAGDSFQPFGMDGKHQKIQDYLVNEKIPLQEKSTVLVLEDKNGQILWLLGFRMAEQIKITKTTKEYLKFKLV